MTITRRTGTLLVCGALLAGMAGCGQDSAAAPAASPTPVVTLPPSVSTTPVASATPAVTATAAEDVYRKAFQATNRLYLQGGLPQDAKADPELASLMTGEALDGTMAIAKEFKTNGITHISGTASITAVRELKGYKHGDSLLALESCEDGRSLRNKRKDGRVTPGQMSYVITTYKVVDGKLKISYIDDSKTVTACPIA